MKKYIRSNNSMNEVNLTDLFNGIFKILIVSDARTYQDGSITASTYFDYSGLPDESLMSLDSDEIHEIDDVDTIARIMKIDPDVLEDWQRTLVINEYKTKIIIEDDDVENVLSDLRHCNRIEVEHTAKNRGFDSQFRLTDQQKLDIIHRLESSDFVNLTKSVSTRHLGNKLIVFMPEVDLKPSSGVFLKEAFIYVKIDLTTVSTDNKVLAVVSFHAAENQSADRPYHTDDADLSDEE